MSRHPSPAPQELLAGYLSFITRHCGLSPVTYRQRRKALSEFLSYLLQHGLSLKSIQVKDLDEFIASIDFSRRSRSYQCVRTNALRGFLRYLFGEGFLERDLSSCVESPRIYREATIPPHFTWTELEQLLASIRGDAPKALRDRAMLALLCIYGLRSGEVASLTLDDIDWTHKVIRFTRRKGGAILVLPLLPVVEAILGQYIRKGRPSGTSCRELLLNNRHRPFASGLSLTNRLHTLVKRAGLRGGRGCHAVRRAVGTHIVESGRGLQEVALILGHQSLSSARVYLRLSMELLRDVADNYGEVL